MEEIMFQGIGNAAQKGNVDVVLAENLVHMRTGAADVFGQLSSRNTLLPHYLFYMVPNMHKKRGICSTCRASGFHAHHINKLFHAKKLAFHNGFLIWYLVLRRRGK